VVIGVVIGGFVTGVISVAAGFLVYDFFFIPPYLTLWVGRPQNWAALGVYVAVMLPVARVVAGLNAARARERRRMPSGMPQGHADHRRRGARAVGHRRRVRRRPRARRQRRAAR
jgi:hypothetical protein